MPKQVLPFTISSDADPGTCIATTAAVASVTLAKGVYKIAAVRTDMQWKLGPTNVTVNTGAFLGAGDQEVIRVGAAGTKLSFIRQDYATNDGKINIVPIEIYELPGQDYRNY